MNASNNILDRISAKTRERISVEMRQVPLSEIRRQAERVLQDSRDFSSHGGSFRRALARPGISFICEVKKASPSKGVIAEHFPYLDIAREYEAAGAAAISCLTEPHWFLVYRTIGCLRIKLKLNFACLYKRESRRYTKTIH